MARDTQRLRIRDEDVASCRSSRNIRIRCRTEFFTTIYTTVVKIVVKIVVKLVRHHIRGVSPWRGSGNPSVARTSP
jgi:hypothetical protein